MLTLLQNANVLDVLAGEIRPDCAIVIEDGVAKVDYRHTATPSLAALVECASARVIGGSLSYLDGALRCGVSGAEPHPRDDVYSLACIAYELLERELQSRGMPM